MPLLPVPSRAGTKDNRTAPGRVTGPGKADHSRAHEDCRHPRADTRPAARADGSGIARDAAGRGLNVLLCEQGDLVGHTSPASTKLIHGGLRYLARPVRPADVVWGFAGVRARDDEDDNDQSAALSRDYALVLDTTAAPLLSVFGGELTTYRQLSREAVDRLAPALGNRHPCRTATDALPGGDIADGDFETFLAAAQRRRPWLPDPLAWRLARNYGSRIERILGPAQALDQLGEHFGADLYEAELCYLVDHEWAMTADDVLWRRSKLGLVIGSGAPGRIETWIARYRGVAGNAR